ncbi:MAG: flagellar export chaperone FliS [Candidatus Loosdrechtia sp.]|uniref:flagellar export chaperone FliS n=1 Tax=Candidatus Loosdrechtia sp. TaxID=3101272 RepID=UPI003A698E03|nr:MAG: flagellar export chaperone FliS [Candidatus Jettenia sp. AMX2]
METQFTNSYKKMQVETADPLTLIIMLYDKVIILLEKAKKDITEKKYEEKNIALNKASDILFELAATLDRDNGREIAVSLAGLYLYIIQEITDANVNLNTKALDNAKRIMSELRESWSGIRNSQNTLSSKADTVTTDINLSG